MNGLFVGGLLGSTGSSDCVLLYIYIYTPVYIVVHDDAMICAIICTHFGPHVGRPTTD